MRLKVLPLRLPLRDERHPQSHVCSACTMREQTLFGALDDEALARIHTHIDTRIFAPGDVVYARGEAGSAMFTVRAGVVRFERVTEGGDRRIVRLAGHGDLFGQETLLNQPYADEAVACTAVQLCRIPRGLVHELGLGEPGLVRELMRRWQQSLESAASWMADMATGAARRRVLKLLAELQRHADDDGRIWLPRRDEMGAMLDMTVETASRMVSRLRRERVLDVRPGRHVRVHPEALAAALRELDAA